MLEKRLREIGQEHIAELLKADFVAPALIEKSLDKIDYGLMQRLLDGHGIYEPASGKVETPEVYTAEFAASEAAAEFRTIGEQLLAEGKVAALIVAGGQGSRLGVAGPKGAVKVSPIKEKTLFAIHSEKVLALGRRHGAAIPLFIMTSEANDAETRACFEENNYFGLSKDDVYFFVQGMLPSITAEGKFILKRDGDLFMNPDGHGGTFTALKVNGCLETMRTRGIEEIFYFQVDNPLVDVCDPLFIGLHSAKGAEMSSKIVRKRDFEEKVGVIGVIDGRTTTMEYSDMPEEIMYAKDKEGQMLYWAGSIAIHVIRRDFVEQLTRDGLALPYHRANKSIPTLGEDGSEQEIAGIKFETFIFDALPMTSSSVVLECRREDEFGPVKNKSGEDSLISSQQMQSDQHRAWLEAAGVKVAPGIKVEISPLFALSAAELKEKALPAELNSDSYFG